MRVSEFDELAEVQGLTPLIEPIAAAIAASDNPRILCAGVVGEIMTQVMTINSTAQYFMQRDARDYKQPWPPKAMP